MKATLKLTCALVLAAALGGVLLQGHALRNVRSENQSLRAQSREIQRLADEIASIKLLRAENREVENLRREVSELHKLRNEVRQLREQTKGLPLIQLENQRLRAATVSHTSAAATASEPPPLMTLDQVSYLGKETPAAAWQSFLWAVRQGNVQIFRKCLTPERQRELEMQTDEQIRARMNEMKSRFAGFRIAATNQLSADEIQLRLQFYVQGNEKPDEGSLPLKRIAYEWKLDLTPY
jgi:myosin heavy subunit